MVNEALLSVETYLARERLSKEKHEYVQGRIYAMAGASRAHITIASNLGGMLYVKFRGTTCQTVTSDMRVGIEESGVYYYPDLSVTCGEPKFRDDAKVDTLLNPIALFEVLSPSTEQIDRSEKFDYYAKIPSLKLYTLISSVQPRVETFEAQSDGSWRREVFTNLTDTATLRPLAIEIPLTDLYERLTFDPDSTNLRAI